MVLSSTTMGEVVSFKTMANFKPKQPFRPTRFRVQYRLGERIFGPVEGPETVLFWIPPEIFGTPEEDAAKKESWHLGEDGEWHEGDGVGAFVAKYPQTEEGLRAYYAGFGLPYDPPPPEPEPFDPYRENRRRKEGRTFCEPSSLLSAECRRAFGLREPLPPLPELEPFDPYRKRRPVEPVPSPPLPGPAFDPYASERKRPRSFDATEAVR